MKRVLATATALLIAAATTFAQDVRQELGDWSIVERTDNTGNGVCTLGRDAGEPRLQLVATGKDGFDGRVRLLFTTPIATSENGSIPDAEISVDRKSWTAEARWVRGGTYVSLPLGDTPSDGLALLSKGHKLTASLLGNTYTVDLAGSGVAVRAFSECIRKQETT
jgi:hypothetical protein